MLPIPLPLLGHGPWATVGVTSRMDFRQTLLELAHYSGYRDQAGVDSGIVHGGFEVRRGGRGLKDSADAFGPGCVMQFALGEWDVYRNNGVWQ